MRRGLGLGLALAVLAGSAQAQTPEPQRFERLRGDGTTIDIALWDRGVGSAGALLVIGGSDCLKNEHRPWMARVIAGSDMRWVVSVDKEGAGAEGNVCSPEYERTSIESQRALDHIRAMTWLKRELALPAVGGFQVMATSAGGAAGCAIASATTDVGALVLMSTAGGRSFEADMRELTQNSERISSEIDRVLSSPRMGATWLGASNPEIWWWSALPLDCAAQMEGWRGRVLILHGNRDESSPVDSARRLAAVLEARPGVEVEYRELDGAGHDLFIAATEKPASGDGLAMALDWLRAEQTD